MMRCHLIVVIYHVIVCIFMLIPVSLSYNNHNNDCVAGACSNTNALLDVFMNYDDDPGFDRFVQYADYYERHFAPFQKKSEVRMLEIGVQSGGSTKVWKQYFGDKLWYVGIDINPRCKAFETPHENVYVEIGSQLDLSFLEDVCLKHGPFDIVIDDGAHTTIAIKASLDILWDCVVDRGIYAIEDTWSMSVFRSKASEGYMLVENLDLFGIVAKMHRQQVSYFDNWNDDGPIFTDPDPVSSTIYSTTTYDGMIVLEKRYPFRPLTQLKRGKTFIPYYD